MRTNVVFDSGLDATDLFAGGGGSAEGLAQAGAPVTQAVNHWRKAVDTHEKNHPGARHDCADISQVHPGRYRRTDIAWMSPDCTNQALRTQGKKRGDTLDDSAPDNLPVDPAERSRATMWDVVRFAEWHDYDAIIVENVPEVVKWGRYRAWYAAMESMNYAGQTVWMNSAHVTGGGAAALTSRDRYYSVWTKKGAPTPDVATWTSPTGQCSCGHTGQLVRAWKQETDHDFVESKYGRTRQYQWACAECSQIVTPHTTPSRTIIDWNEPARGLFERNPQLVANTMRKIRGGLPLHAIDGMATAFIVELRGGGSHSRSVEDPLSTITAKGNHHALLTPPGYDPATGRGTVPVEAVSLADCTYRILTPHERKLATAFRDSYVLLGTPADQVRMIGNAVTPNAARALGGSVVQALTGTSHLDRPLTLAA